MNAFMLQHELAIRLACFFGVFGVMALWELAAPGMDRFRSRALHGGRDHPGSSHRHPCAHDCAGFCRPTLSLSHDG